MPKIRLDVEALQVESFATLPGDGKEGTVHAREFTLAFECPSVQSGGQGCPGGCQNSGNSSCVWCLAPDSGTCEEGCSWTFGDGFICLQ